MSDQLETAKRLLALAQEYFDKGDAAEAAKAMAQAEEIAVEPPSSRPSKDPQCSKITKCHWADGPPRASFMATKRLIEKAEQGEGPPG